MKKEKGESKIYNDIRKAKKSERTFFEDDKEYIRYNETCLSCMNPCKQSFRVHIVGCIKYDKAHTPDEYYQIINKTPGRLDSVGKEIGINSRTVKSMLLERQDMTKEVYQKLEDLLFPKKKKAKKNKK